MTPRSDSRAEPGFARREPTPQPERANREGGGSRGNHGFTRAFNAPRRALVESHCDGVPRQVNRRDVAVVREEWRVVDRWWTDEPVDRRYFDVVLATGENAVIFRDGEAGGWFTQRA